MSRTFQDESFLVWEVYSSGGRHGFSDDVDIVFHCTTDRALRSRRTRTSLDEARAQRRIAEASDEDLRAMLEAATDIP